MNFAQAEDAQKAIENYNNVDLDGRTIIVVWIAEPPERTSGEEPPDGLRWKEVSSTTSPHRKH